MANENAKTRGGQQAATPTELKQETSRAAEKRPLVPKDIDPHTIITVRNGFQGRLVYRSKKTGERFVWDSFGAEQDMEIGRASQCSEFKQEVFHQQLVHVRRAVDC